jgi:Protein of unknown function (DUF2911)
MFFVPALLLAATLGSGNTPIAAVHPDTTCPHRNVPLEGRKSPLDSLTFSLSGKEVKLCYGRPSSRGRTMLGGADIPYGKLWRTGANEPTIFYAPVPLTVAGIKVSPGVYSLYTVPGKSEWEVIVNRSISQWGKEDQYTADVKAQEVGRAKVKSESISKPVETFTIRAEPKGGKAATLVLEWEKTQVKLPVGAAS